MRKRDNGGMRIIREEEVKRREIEERHVERELRDGEI